jgi:tRNA-(ms[2]io[6]A)-hydroxylase
VFCLTHRTDPRWAELALEDLDAVLVDHAHCELKAATNALSLAARSPGHPAIARALVALAAEEVAHLAQVMDELGKRGLSLGPPQPDDYAAELRKRATASSKRRGPEDALVDRLLVGALIEARSCERFRLLADALQARGQGDLAAFYEELFACEARHYRTFVDLAAGVLGDEPSARERLAVIAEAEGQLAATLGLRASIHG